MPSSVLVTLTYRPRHACRRPGRRRAIAGVLALVAAPLGGVATDGAALATLPPPSALVDVNPNATPTPLWGGRLEAIAVDPVNPLTVFAASELGGHWVTTNGALTWEHIDALPMPQATDVAIAPQDSSFVVATGLYEGSQTSRGGTYRSTDGGVTWAKIPGSDPPCSTEAHALNVSLGAGTGNAIPVYVATSCGLSYSPDSGATWTHTDPAGSFSNGLTGYRGIDDVVVRPGAGSNLQVDVCGTQGFFRSEDGGSTWTAPDPNSPTFRDADGAGPLGNAFGPCTIATDPADPNTVFLSNFSNSTASGFCQAQLLESNNAGAAGTWTAMGVTDANCRDPFVETQPSNDGDPTHYDVYFGTSVRLLRQTCDRDNAPTDCLTGAGNWTRWDQNTPHTDPSDVAFDGSVPTGCPMYVGGDFGLMRPTSNGCGVTPTFAMRNVGLHALDSSQFAGMVAPAAMHLYYGTQDNGIFASTDGGATWTNRGPDVYGVNVDRTDNADASVLWRPCFGCGIVRSTPGLTSDIAFTTPPGADVPNNYVATQFGPRSYAFVTPDVAAGPGIDQIWTVYVTTDAGGSWTQFGSALPGDPVPGGGSGPGSHGAIQASGPADSPTFFLGLRVSGQNRIYRLAGPLDTSQPTNNATLTLASTGLDNAFPFGVDPANPNLLYAADLTAQRMMRSTNGGSTWTPDFALSSLVTQNGAKKFVSNALGGQVRGIGFSPFDKTIMVGTRTAGLFASVNDGASWITVRGGEAASFALDFAFDHLRNDVYVGTRGRGVFRIDLPSADLSITKTDAPDPATAGQQVTYTITVSNAGPDAAGGVVVTDTLPVDVHYVTSSLPCVAVPAAAGDIVTCDVGSLDSGQARAFTITTAVDPEAVSARGGPFTAVNTATVASSDSVDPDLTDNTATSTTVVNDLADVVVTKICDPPAARAGEPIHCTVYADNMGPSDARGVVLTDRITSDGSFTISNVNGGVGSTCTPVTAVPGGRQFECNLGTLRAATTSVSGRKTMTYDITATEGQQLDNLAKARSDTPDPDDTSNTSVETLTIESVADLSLVKVGPATATAGENATYVMRAFNNGPSTARNVTIADTLPAGVEVLSVSAIGANCVAGVPGDPLQPATCGFGSLAPGAVTSDMRITVRVLPDTLGTLHNAARVSSDTFDSANGNDLDMVDTTVQAVADVVAGITDSPDPVVAGTPMSYRIQVSNTGPSTARNTAVTNELPGWLTLTGTTVENGEGVCALVNGVPNAVECQVGALDPGEYRVVVVSGLVRSAAPHGATLTGTVAAVSTTADSDAGDNAASATTAVQRVADLAVTLTSDAAVYKPSTTIHYAITLTNLGPSDAKDVVVTQQLPPAKYGYFVSNDDGCTVAGTLLTCPTIAELAAGTTKVYVVNWFVQGSKGTITSTASVSSATSDPVAGNNSSTRSVLRK